MLPQQRHGEESCSHQLPVIGHAYERPGKPAGHGGRLQGPATQVRELSHSSVHLTEKLSPFY